MNGIDIVVSKSRTFSVRGKIVGFNSKTYQGTRVQLEAADVSWEINTRGTDVAPDGQGSFEFSGVTAGSYIVSATVIHENSFLSGSRLVHVQDSDLEDVSLVPSGNVLGGRLRLDGHEKIDFSKLHPRLLSSYSSALDGMVGQDGGVTFYGFGHFTYRVGLVGGEDFYIKSVRVGGREFTDGTVDLSGMEEQTGTLEIVLGAGSRIDGIVTTDDGKPAENAVVVLIPERQYRYNSALFKNITTNQNGQFALRGIAPGKYKLFAWDDIEPGIWWSPKFLADYEAKGEDVSVEGAGHLSSQLHVMSSITVTQ